MAYTNIKKSSDYFNTKLYTGTGSSLALTGIGHQPDFVWIKPRNEARGHHLFDAVRGVGKSILSNETSAEGTNAQTITAFGSDGFTVGTSNDVNKSSNTHVAWNWKANGAGSSNTDGSITSTVSANTTSGFSIVSYTGNGTAGATIGHGLGAVPSLILTKNRTSAYNWHLWTHAFSSYNDTIQLNTTAAKDTGTLLNNTAPTSSLITLGSSAVINESSSDQLAYVFAEKKGFSKIGSYTGNGSTDGTFVYTGFKPAFFITKRSDVANSWVMFDNKRDPHNEVIKNIYANTSDVEETDTTNNDLDFLSNGIKIREDNNALNASGGTYIYMAFAEEPLVGDNPATAR